MKGRISNKNTENKQYVIAEKGVLSYNKCTFSGIIRRNTQQKAYIKRISHYVYVFREKPQMICLNSCVLIQGKG